MPLHFGSLHFTERSREGEINGHEMKPDQLKTRKKRFFAYGSHQGRHLVWCYAKQLSIVIHIQVFLPLTGYKLSSLNMWILQNLWAELPELQPVCTLVEKKIFVFFFTPHINIAVNLYICICQWRKKNKRVVQISSTTCVKNNLFPFLCSQNEYKSINEVNDTTLIKTITC